MARGFESKSVADQQESAEARVPHHSDLERAEPAVLQRRRRLELSREDVIRHLASARAEAHRATLERALEALESELERLR